MDPFSGDSTVVEDDPEPTIPHDLDASTVEGKVRTVVSSIDSLHWDVERPDFARTYLNGFIERPGNGTIMPPTPGFSVLSLRGEFHPAKLLARYKITATMRPEAWAVLRDLRGFQLDHRSRLCAFGIGPLRYNELKRRIGRTLEFRSEYERIALSPKQSLDYALGIVDTTMKHLKYDSAYVAKYIKEHPSSLGGGVRWSDLTLATSEQWGRILTSILAALGRIRLACEKQAYLHSPYFTGSRSRSEDLTWDGAGEISATAEVNRTRLIVFKPGMSMWNAFLPNKREWVRECLRVCGVPDWVSIPNRDGGVVYERASEWLRNGMKHTPYDGTNWESAVPYILGPAFRPFSTVAEVDHLPSGIALTSLLGTVAAYHAQDRLLSGERELCILGDDVNAFAKKSLRSQRTGNILEFQPDDHKASFMLGVGYAPDPLVPRVYGLKVTTDRADKVRPLAIDSETGKFSSTIVGRASQEMISLWTDLYQGKFGGRSLIEALSAIEAKDYIRPSELLENVQHQALNRT